MTLNVPSRWEEVLNPAGMKYLTHARTSPILLPENGWLYSELVVLPEVAKAIGLVLEATMPKNLVPGRQLLPGTKSKAYECQTKKISPRIWDNNWLYLDIDNRESADALYRRKVAQKIYDTLWGTGIPQLFSSDTFNEWLKNFSGESSRVEWDGIRSNIQISRYVKGNHCGIHCDYFGTPKKAVYSLDFHLTMVNDWVKRQLVLYGFPTMNKVQEVHHNGLATMYRLPTWHQVTPLEGLDGGDPIRWLILVSRMYKDDAFPNYQM